MKIIVCDMSGIASDKGKNNDQLLNVLNNLKNFSCSFCTGKGYKGGYETLKNIDLKIPFICENGSVIVSKEGEVLYNDKMNPQKVEEVIRKIATMPFEFLAYVDLSNHKYKFLRGSKELSEELSQPWFYSEEIYNDVDEFLKNIDKNNVCRLTTRGWDITNLKEFSDFHIVISENEFHSICNLGINKGSGVRMLAKLCNVDIKDIIIIGNDMNDIDMFKLDCGYKIATGKIKPPQELLNLASVYVPLDELPEYIQKIDRGEIL